MNNPKVIVEVDGEEREIELLLLSASRRLSDEHFIQKTMGFERYRDWSTSGEGWSAPDAQIALIQASLNKADINFDSVDADASVIVDAIREALTEALEDDALDPTSGE